MPQSLTISDTVVTHVESHALEGRTPGRNLYTATHRGTMMRVQLNHGPDNHWPDASSDQARLAELLAKEIGDEERV